MTESKNFVRRDFIKVLAGGGAVLIALKAAPKVGATKPSGSGDHQWVSEHNPLIKY